MSRAQFCELHADDINAIKKLIKMFGNWYLALMIDESVNDSKILNFPY
jgi:hypothetical protein